MTETNSANSNKIIRKGVTIILLLCATIAAHAQTGTWSGKIDVQGTALPLVFHLDDNNATMDSPAQGIKGIPMKIERSLNVCIAINIPTINATYNGIWKDNQVMGTFSQHGVSFPLTLTPGEQKPNRPQTPKEPFPYATEEVSFANGDATLKGTLALPQGYNRHTPVFIMVTGSGLQNRDEEIFEHKPFAVIADALARAGIATLRYDDRGFGESKGDVVNCTTEDLKNDAAAGIALLRQRFDKVGVIGHSEGGTIAFMLAAEGKADYVVSLAGMAVSGKETLLWQNQTMLASSGLPKADADAYCGLLAEAFDACIAGNPAPPADRQELSDMMKQNYQAVIMQLRSPYMKYFLALDIRPMLNKVKCPILAFNGTKDTQVEPTSNLGALRTQLSSNAANHIEAIDGVNHLFQHCTTGAITEYQAIEETFSPEVLEKMIRWMKQLQ